MADSASGGYLLPEGPLLPPDEDQTLAIILQALVVGVSGLPGPLVRPRWQLLPPAQPAANTDWAAIGVTEETPDTYSYVEHDPTGDGGLGNSVIQRHESLLVLTSFYGPNAQGYARRLGIGLMIAQNREALGLAGIKLQWVGPSRHVPEEVNTQWIKRVDVELGCRRNQTESFAVRNIASVQGTGQDEASPPFPIITE